MVGFCRLFRPIHDDIHLVDVIDDLQDGTAFWAAPLKDSPNLRYPLCHRSRWRIHHLFVGMNCVSLAQRT